MKGPLPMLQQPVPVIPSNRVIRDLETKDFPSAAVGSQSTVTVDVLPDAIYRKLICRLSGALQTTINSGSPLVDQLSTWGSLVDHVDITASNGSVIKSVNPYMMQQLQLLATGNLGERKCSTGAAALTPANPTADAGWTWPTSTQYTSVAETFEIGFEDNLAGIMRDYTALDLVGLSSCKLKFYCKAFTALQRLDDTASLTFANSTLKIDVKGVLGDAKQRNGRVLMESFQVEPFSAAATERKIKLDVGFMLRGIGFLCRDGDTTKKLTSNAIGRIRGYVGDGANSREVFSTTFQELQAQNMSENAYSAAFASNLSRRDGFAYWDALQNKNPRTAVDLTTAKAFYLVVTTAASGSGATYTNPVELTIHPQQYWNWRS